MPEHGIRSTYSQCPFQVIMHDDHGEVGSGTAFFLALDDEWFLVTNWHNLSGRDFVTKSLLHPERRSPTYIKARLSTYMNDAAFGPVAYRVDIFNDQEPLWYEHPSLGSGCDVVALPFERPKDCPEYMHNAANLISSVRVPVEPGVPVFIIGFPMAISVGAGLPVWKSGYIASEPFYDVTIGANPRVPRLIRDRLTIPAFFIDSQTREGMSGSPIFASYTGAWDTVDPYRPLNFEEPGFWNRSDVVLGGTAREFIGCYSGRVPSVEGGAALGICWKHDAIEEICSAKKRGEYPH